MTDKDLEKAVQEWLDANPDPTDPHAKYSDRTRRAFDALQLHYQAVGAEAAGWWVAIRLSDGGSDGNLYRSKMEATRFQLHESQCAYICLPHLGEMTIGEIDAYLKVNEKIYDQGGRLSDTETHVVPMHTARPGMG